jgi:hypothetical protein
MAPEQLIIDGPINGRTVHLELKLRDLNSFLLHARVQLGAGSAVQSVR